MRPYRRILAEMALAAGYNIVAAALLLVWAVLSG